MKNVVKTFFISMLVIFALSCAQENLNQKSSISIQLPGANSRDAVSTQVLSYVLTATPEGKKGKEATVEGLSGENVTVEVQVGTYTVNLKAYAQDDTDRATLLYEGTVTGVEVLYKEDTAVSIKMTKMTSDKPAEEPEKPSDEPENPAEEPETPTEDPETPAEEPEALVTVTAKGMTVKQSDKGFEITVTHTAENSQWTFAQVVENSEGTFFDLYPSLEKLNKNESVTFTYPFVNKESYYIFTFKNDDNNDENKPNETASIDAIGGSGILDYTEYNKLDVSLSDGNYKERFLNVSGLTSDTTKIFKDYKTVEFAYKLYSSTEDWSKTVWAGERDCDITQTGELYYYQDLLANGKMNIFDTKYNWNDFDALNTKLSTYKKYWAQILFYFTNDATVGRFGTKCIQSLPVDYNPVSKDGIAEISVVKAVPSFEIKGESSVRLMDKGYKFTATPVSGKFNEGTEYCWYLNGKLIEDVTSNEALINLSKTKTLIGDNVLTCAAKFNGEIVSNTYSFDVWEYNQGMVFYNSGSNGLSWATTYDGIYEFDGIHNSDQRLYSFCYDDDFNLYLAVHSGSINSNYSFETGEDGLRIIKYTYNKKTSRYDNNPSYIASLPYNDIDNVHEYPVRMACDGKNVYYITATAPYEISKFTGAKVYTVPVSGTSNIQAIDFSSDYSYVTAVACLNNRLYVGGVKLSAKTTVTGMSYGYYEEEIEKQTADYSVNSYTIDNSTSSDKKIYLSYNDSDIENTSKIINSDVFMGKDSSTTSYFKEVCVGSLISDLFAGNGTVYALALHQVYVREMKKVESEWENKNTYSAYTEVIYLDNGTMKSIKTPLSPEPNSYETIQPVRIIAIKPKELVFADGCGDSQSCYDTLDLDSQEMILSEYGYGFKFDSVINGSGPSFNIDLHASNVIYEK